VRITRGLGERSRKELNKESVAGVLVHLRLNPTIMKSLHTNDGFDSFNINGVRQESVAPDLSPKVSPPLLYGRLSDSGADDCSKWEVYANPHTRAFISFP
jgi:hypothetical protein